MPITWRYFIVELLTAILFAGLVSHFGPVGQSLFWCLFFAALMAAFFIDLELYIIPDELNAFALGMGIAADLYCVLNGVAGHELLGGWLPRSIAGAMLCAAIFVLIQLLGQALFHRDAMGDGDVKLARAIGAMLPLSLALVSFFFAIAIGAVVGVAMLAFQSRSAAASAQPDDMELEPEDGMTPIRTTLLYGVLYITFLDLALQIGAALKIQFICKLVESLSPSEEETPEDFVPGPTHIPFGPYMVAGALLAVFWGQTLLNSYLKWAFPNV